MAPAYLSIWRQCLQELQRLPATIGNSTKELAAYQKISAQMKDWEALPALSAAAWRALVLDLKVPAVLFSVCCQVLPALQTQPKCSAACVAFWALDTFFRKASKEGAFSLRGTAVSLVPGIRLQAQQSGLMDTLKAAMTAVAEDWQHPGPQQQQPAPAFADYDPTFQTFLCLTRTWTLVCHLWPEGRERLAALAVAAPAAVQLSAAVLQLVSRDLTAAVKAAAPKTLNLSGPGRGQSQAVHRSYAFKLCWVVYQVELAMCLLSDGIIRNGDGDNDDPFSLPELRPLNTPEFASVLATLLVVTSEALLAQQQVAKSTVTASTPSTTGGSSSSTARSSTHSSSNGSSSTSTVGHSRTATTSSGTSKDKVVHRWVKEAIKNLPQCTKALLHILDMDSTAVIWAAAAQRDTAMFGTVMNFRVLTFAFNRLMCCLSPPAANPQLEGVTVVVSPTREQAHRQQLLLLVPATLLHWVSNKRATTHDDLQQCALIAWCAGDIISYWLPSSKVVEGEVGHSTGLNLQTCGPWLQPYFPAVWLEQVLPDIQKVLALLLQQPWGPLALTSTDKLAADAPQQLVRLQCRILQSATGREEKFQDPPEGLTVGSLTPNATLAKPWLGVTVQTLASLECFIRASAQQLAAGSMLSSQTVAAVVDIQAAVDSKGNAGLLLSLDVAAGPGSPEQQQLYSLLSSLIKFSALAANSSLSDSENLVAIIHGSLIEVAISAGIALLNCRLAQELEGCDESSSSSTAATQHPAGALSSPTALLAAGSSTAPSAAAALAVALLPSLVLVGRCFLLWAQHLQQALPALLRLHARRGSIPPLQALSGSALDDFITCSEQLQAAIAVVFLCFSQETFATTVWLTAASCILNWLTAPAVAEKLAAAGHDTQQLPQLLQELLSACSIAAEAWPSDGFTEATAMALVQQLQVTGRALAGLAVPTMCCNPSCSNIAGPSDLQLVSGRSCLCGGCRTARYCSRTCQKAAWKQHKPAYSALAAAAATATSAAAAAAATAAAAAAPGAAPGAAAQQAAPATATAELAAAPQAATT